MRHFFQGPYSSGPVDPVSSVVTPASDSAVGVPQDVVQSEPVEFNPMLQIGRSGLKQYGGFLFEEFLNTLRGKEGARAYREVLDNSPLVGGILRLMELTIRQVEKRVEPFSDDQEDVDRAERVEGALDDMSHTWEDFLAEVCSMFAYGFAPMEIVWKKCEGWQEDGQYRSRFDDGLLMPRKIYLLAQDTLFRWDFDVDGGVRAMIQLPPPDYLMRTVPIEKMLLFRPHVEKGNPEGRALAPDTMIPTPDGWMELDAVQAGDKVFDEKGRVRYVVARQDWEDRPCYRLTFSDGNEIVADENHLWHTRNQYERNKDKPGKIRTTKEIVETLKAKTSVSNHAIAWAEPLDFPRADLIVDPYFLGLWLGDGDSQGTTITCHADDLEETADAVVACGYQVNASVNGNPEGKGRRLRVYGSGKHAPDAPARKLRALGVLNNKHIPPAYMRGSIEQRLALLSGLMDSDGHVDWWGRCEFSNINAGLAHGVAELVRSLGVSAYVTTKKNSIGNMAWLVKFTPTLAPFRLARKRARCKTTRAREMHYITAAEPVAPQRTVCIEVDGPGHMFLAGQGMVPTHNSLIRAGYFNWVMIKRLTEFEAIQGERDATGVPIARIPAVNMGATATLGQQAVFTKFKKLVENIRVDDQMGCVIPSDMWPETKTPMFSLELLSAGGKTAHFDYGAVITRHEVRLAMSMLADVMLLGHDKVGSFALAKGKQSMLADALGAWLDAIYGVLDRHLLPRIYAMNGWPMDRMCSVGHGEVSVDDIDSMANAIQKLAQAGMPLFPDLASENHIRAQMGLPQRTEDDDLSEAMALEQQREDARFEAEQQRADLVAQGKVPAQQPGQKVPPPPVKKFRHQPRSRRGVYSPRSGDDVTALHLLRQRAQVGMGDSVNHGFLVRDEGEPYNRAEADAAVEQAKVERVPLKILVATQPTVRRDGVRNFLDNPGVVVPGQRSLSGVLVDRPVIARVEGKNYIHDGHHRLAAKALLGDQDALVRVVELEPRVQAHPSRPTETTGLPANQGTPRAPTSALEQGAVPGYDPNTSLFKTPPWKVEQRDGKWAVVGVENGKVYGTHDSKAEALAHQRALYANVPDARKGNDVDRQELVDALKQAFQPQERQAAPVTVNANITLPESVTAVVKERAGVDETGEVEAIREQTAALREQTAAIQALDLSPQINVAAPTVNVAPTEVYVETPAPTVNVNPQIDVHPPTPKPVASVSEVERDSEGNIVRVTRRPKE